MAYRYSSLSKLTPAHKAFIKANHGTMDLVALAQHVSGETEVDRRSAWVRAIKEYLAELTEDPLAPPAPKGPLPPLTEAQRNQVVELLKSGKVNTAIEMTRIVYNDSTLQPLTHQYRLVHAYMKEVYPDAMDAADEPVEEGQWEPPNSIATLCGLVNQCVPNGTQNMTYRYGQMTTQEQRQLRSLMGYMRVLRFAYHANEYERKIDRNLYISTFIRFTHDKTDLTAEEVDQYISAAVETVNVIQIDRNLQRIDKAVDEIMAGDRESRGQFMPLVELINTTRSKSDQSKERLKKLIDGLVGTRNERVASLQSRNSSILNLFEAVWKSEERRADMAHLGLKEKEEDKQEAGRLRDIDDVTALICGQTMEEAGS